MKYTIYLSSGFSILVDLDDVGELVKKIRYCKKRKHMLQIESKFNEWINPDHVICIEEIKDEKSNEKMA